MAAAYSLRPRPLPLALGALACAAGIALGQWQAGRAEQKKTLGARIDAAMSAPPVELSPDAPPSEYLLQHVAAKGRFVAERTVFLANRLRHGRPGYEVVTPLKVGASNAHVMVDRGWRAGDPSGTPPEVRTPAGEVRVEGLALERLPRVMELGDPATGNVRQNLDLQSFAAQSGLRVLPLVIEQRSSADDALERDWPRPDAGVAMHESYSLQWYSLAALGAVLGAFFAFRRVRPA